MFGLVQMVAPSEVYLNPKALTDSGLSAEDVAAFLADYRYGDNIGPYIRPAGPAGPAAANGRSRRCSRLVHRRAREHGPRAFGATAYEDADPGGMPVVTW